MSGGIMKRLEFVLLILGILPVSASFGAEK
jgi:hypothetical protein